MDIELSEWVVGRDFSKDGWYTYPLGFTQLAIPHDHLCKLCEDGVIAVFEMILLRPRGHIWQREFMSQSCTGVFESDRLCGFELHQFGRGGPTCAGGI